MADVTPVTLLTGVSGAPTGRVLQQALPERAAARIAVVAAQPEAWLRWTAGCACCSPRDDVARSLRVLLPRARRDEISRVVIDAAGGSDPGPILATLLSDTVAASAYRLDRVVTVVDAAQSGAIMAAQDMAMRQVALADWIVLSGPDATHGLRTRLRRLNPGARIIASDEVSMAMLGAAAGGPGEHVEDLSTWLDPAAFADEAAVPDTEPADAAVHAVCFTADCPLPWRAVSEWLERLVLLHGDRVLRMKAVLHVQARPGPVAIHSARHLLFPPRMLPSWPDGDSRRSRIALIARGLGREEMAPDPAVLSAISEIGSPAQRRLQRHDAVP